jgi:Hint module
LCDLNAIKTVACPNCAVFNLDGLCESCEVCTNPELEDLCDLNDIFKFGCAIGCDDEDPDVDPDEDNACFSEVATVQVEGKGPVAMKDLQLGEKVLTASHDYEPVYAFGHRHLTQAAKFIQFNDALEITGAHLVFVEGKVNPVRADSVKVGDFLQGGEVKSIKTIQRAGVYTPLTPR